MVAERDLPIALSMGRSVSHILVRLVNLPPLGLLKSRGDDAAIGKGGKPDRVWMGIHKRTCWKLGTFGVAVIGSHTTIA
jgi:hypothetical protein